VLVGHLAEASIALGMRNLSAELLADVEHLAGSCGVNGAVVAFAGPFAHTAGVLAADLGDEASARSLLRRSIDTSRRLGAVVWERRGEVALRSVEGRFGSGGPTCASEPEPEVALLVRQGGVWKVSWRDESASLPHLKGLADIAALVSRRGEEVHALELAGGTATIRVGQDEMIDVQALAAYRRRLHDLDREIDDAERDADLGRSAQLEAEREQLLAEVRRATGLGGRIRSHSNDPAERARKAVSGRLRDAIGRLAEEAPLLAAHLDRSITTGLRCSYAPSGDDALISWSIET
jgi:hypothetical protein